MDNQWRKATYSNGQAECVEAGQGLGSVLVRDTKDHGCGPVLSVGAGAWAEFLSAVR